MRRKFLVAVVACAVSALSAGASVVACGTSAATGSPPDGGVAITPGSSDVPGALPCDVEKVLADNCRKCHSDPAEFGAPMPLVTMTDLHRPAHTDAAKRVYELIPGRIAAVTKPMPPSPNPRLSATDRSIMTSWATAGAAAREASDAACGTTPPKVEPGVACKPDLSIGPAKPYAVNAGSGDEYVCYGVELSKPTPTHVTAFVPRIDNKTVVHHVVLYEADAATSPTPTPCSAGGSLRWRMVMGWAPGGIGLEMPPEAGFPLATTGRGTTHYVVQMHYSNPQGLVDQTDRSGFELCTAPPRTYEADVLAFGTQAIDIPAGAATYEKNCSITVPQSLAGLHLVAAMPHMHQLGTAMSTQLFAGGPSGKASDLGTIAAWSFDTQAWLGIASGVVTKANDVIKTRCAWKNATGRRVSFGENTADEMCYSFTVYYPKVQARTWSWASPSLTSQCE